MPVSNLHTPEQLELSESLCCEAVNCETVLQKPGAPVEEHSSSSSSSSSNAFRAASTEPPRAMRHRHASQLARGSCPWQQLQRHHTRTGRGKQACQEATHDAVRTRPGDVLTGEAQIQCSPCVGLSAARVCLPRWVGRR